MKNSMVIIIAGIGLIFQGQLASAWGRRGHSTIAQTAAYAIAGSNPKLSWLKAHSFDLGYYANVPDLVWKKPATYKTEAPQHFMDMELFDRALKAKNEKIADKLLIPNRIKFQALHPNIPLKYGRALWRIQEMATRLDGLTKKLRDTHLGRKEHRKLQGEWLVTAGALGHYVGDMSMPLHCSDDYDGQKSHQNGIHSFFEEKVVDELFPRLEEPMLQTVQARFKRFNAKHKNQTPFQLALELCRNSEHSVPKLLALDKKLGRTNMKKVLKGYRNFVLARLSIGSLYLAEIWGRDVHFKFDNKRFYFFDGSPAYIWPVGMQPHSLAHVASASADTSSN